MSNDCNDLIVSLNTIKNNIPGGKYHQHYYINPRNPDDPRTNRIVRCDLVIQAVNELMRNIEISFKCPPKTSEKIFKAFKSLETDLRQYIPKYIEVINSYIQNGLHQPLPNIDFLFAQMGGIFAEKYKNMLQMKSHSFNKSKGRSRRNKSRINSSPRNNSRRNKSRRNRLRRSK
jgi:hypothetical protein